MGDWIDRLADEQAAHARKSDPRSIRREGAIGSLLWVAEKLRRIGATLPAPEPAGTIESAMQTSASCILAIVEVEIERLRGES